MQGHPEDVNIKTNVMAHDISEYVHRVQIMLGDTKTPFRFGNTSSEHQRTNVYYETSMPALTL